MNKKVNIHGVKVDNITIEQAVNKILQMTKEDHNHSIYTPNSEMIMHAYRDLEFKNILNSASLILPDGAGVILASKILKRKLVQKVSGIDVVKRLLPLAETNKLSIYLFGGAEKVAETAAVNIISSHKNLSISGYHNGFFTKEEESTIIENINSTNTDILFVGLGVPKQEKWIHENLHKLNCKVCIGVGGSIDVLAGNAKLAPSFIRKAGFEWLYRLIKQPWRFKRMMDLPRFIILTLKTRFKK